MAVNPSDKKAIADVVLPEVHFNVTSTGVTISSKRLSTARFVPFNQPGKCRNCKSSDLELDHVITKEGITLYCSRIKVDKWERIKKKKLIHMLNSFFSFKGSKFIAFDHTYEYPEHCFFRLKSRGHVYNIPHGQQVVPPEEQVTVLQEESQKRPSDQQAIDDQQFIKPKQIKQAVN